MIIQRYIYREILHRFVWITGLLLIIFTTNKFLDYLDDAADGEIPANFVLKLLSMRMLAMQTEVLPCMLFLAVILAYSRLNQDNELAVLAAAGLGKRFQLAVVMRFCLVFTLLFSIIVFIATPWAKEQIIHLNSIAWQEASFSTLAAGQFKEINKGRSVVYVENLSDDKKSMRNVFLQVRDDDDLSVIKSDRAYFDVDEATGNRFIIFSDGRRYQGRPGSLDFRITEYEKYAALIEVSEGKKDLNYPDILSTWTLAGSSDPKHQAELQWRISAIVLCVLLSILGVLLNQYPFGQKPFTLLLFGIMIYFLYSNLLGITRTLLERDTLPAWLGLWWVHGIVVVLIFVIYHYTALVQYLRRDSEDVQVLSAE